MNREINGLRGEVIGSNQHRGMYAVTIIIRTKYNENLR